MRKGLLTLLVSGLLMSCSAVAGVTSGEPPQIDPNTSTNSVVSALALTEPQKLQIRSEEIYRSQIQQQLLAESDGTKTRANQIWADLNSPFIQWLLSSVVISGLVAAYTLWQSRREKAKLNNELIEKLDTEISNRIYEALSGTRSYEGCIKNNLLWQPNTYYTQVYSFLNNHFDSSHGETHTDFSIFPEFKDCSFRSLVTMLYDALKSDKRNATETAKFKDVLIASESFANLGSIWSKESNLSQDDTLRLLLRIREILNTRILIARWSKDDLY